MSTPMEEGIIFSAPLLVIRACEAPVSVQAKEKTGVIQL